MHNIGFYVSSNAIFDAHDNNKRFRDTPCTSDWPERHKKHK